MRMQTEWNASFSRHRQMCCIPIRITDDALQCVPCNFWELYFVEDAHGSVCSNNRMPIFDCTPYIFSISGSSSPPTPGGRRLSLSLSPSRAE